MTDWGTCIASGVVYMDVFYYAGLYGYADSQIGAFKGIGQCLLVVQMQCTPM